MCLCDLFVIPCVIVYVFLCVVCSCVFVLLKCVRVVCLKAVVYYGPVSFLFVASFFGGGGEGLCLCCFVFVCIVLFVCVCVCKSVRVMCL